MSYRNLDAVRAELAPSGVLTCALNHGNVVLVRRGATEDTPSGVSVDLARALADALHVPVAFRHFDKAGAVSESAGTGEWNVCFLAVDPKRAETIAYSEPYVQIEGAFLVSKESGASTLADIDRLNQRIGAVKGSAYELFLSRHQISGQLVRFDSFPDVIDALESGVLDGIAGVRQAMDQVAGSHPAFEVLEEPFMAIPQAVGVSVKDTLGASFVAEFIKDRKADGFVRRSLDASGHCEVRVPD